MTVVTREEIARTGAEHRAAAPADGIGAFHDSGREPGDRRRIVHLWRHRGVDARPRPGPHADPRQRPAPVAVRGWRRRWRVNVNSIPVAAIERIEVLRDGASAIYGSDAIAGVVNFILTKDYTGVEAGGQYGAPTRSGGGESWDVHAVAGWGDLAHRPLQRHVVCELREGRSPVGQGSRVRGDGQPVPVSGCRAPPARATFRAHGHRARIRRQRDMAGRLAGATFGTPASSYGSPPASANDCESINMFRNPLTWDHSRAYRTARSTARRT